MNNCYLCRQVLSKENESVEHIIPNSIGGRLKSKKLLCKKCKDKKEKYLKIVSFY